MSSRHITATSSGGRVVSLQTFVAVGAAGIVANMAAPGDPKAIWASLPAGLALVSLCTVFLKRATKPATQRLLHNGPTLCTITATVAKFLLDGRSIDPQMIIVCALTLASMVEMLALPLLRSMQFKLSLSVRVLVKLRLRSGGRRTKQAPNGESREFRTDGAPFRAPRPSVTRAPIR